LEHVQLPAFFADDAWAGREGGREGGRDGWVGCVEGTEGGREGGREGYVPMIRGSETAALSFRVLGKISCGGGG